MYYNIPGLLFAIAGGAYFLAIIALHLLSPRLGKGFIDTER